MNGAVAQPDRGRWAVCGFLVLALHVSALLLLCDHTIRPNVPLPEPVLLEFAPAPPAPPAATQPLQARSIAPAHVEAPRALAPIPTVREAPVTLPRARPMPPRPPADTPPTQADTPPVPPAPAAPPHVASPSPAVVASWQAQLVAHIARFRNFPIEAQRRREQGVVTMRFTMDREGHVIAMAMLQGSGYPDLDSEARAWIARAEPMPSPPKSQGPASVVLPLRFTLR